MLSSLILTSYFCHSLPPHPDQQHPPLSYGVAYKVTLVLVAPAFSIKKNVLNTTAATTDSSMLVLQAVRDAILASNIPLPTKTNPIQNRSNQLINMFNLFWSRFQSLYRYPLKLILRRLVHSDSFWRDGLSAAWAPSSKGGVQMVGPSVPHKLETADIFRYKLASMAANFDDDLFRFVTAQKMKEPGSFPSPEVVPGVDQSTLLAGTSITTQTLSIHLLARPINALYQHTPLNTPFQHTFSHIISSPAPTHPLKPF